MQSLVWTRVHFKLSHLRTQMTQMAQIFIDFFSCKNLHHLRHLRLNHPELMQQLEMHSQ
jgi:hypothetical protein